MPDVRKLLRAPKNYKIKEEDAGRKPLSSGDKATDKQTVLEMAQRISALQDILYAQRKHKILIVLQGMDTSGKDGTVRGVFGQIDPLGVSCTSFKAPTELEKSHDFLWRVHPHVPGNGELAIFNRSHYEDVLITRVHEWIDEAECKRRHAHICDFERMLAETGTVIIKCFLHISNKEQKARLEERIADPDKHWKLRPEDLEERQYWSDYLTCYTDAINATNAPHAPWYVIPADSKTHRNLAIASLVLETLESLDLAYPAGNPDYAKLKVV
ncbi:MAG: polyphosphate kinase 2 family protein [Oxalicibacterium faecigallinarum]|uniref:PPK2 family polyphosphate kinase n=1 Tax=Oxalicibacterium faecigallinarum TaxID=573741 RepID=UPI002807B903|nr:PPK2 family polyphosphate kinase [Oxalicibacterium faecigallinarum]MDQ7970508.1 polyphosphate kinase 2 family protein [Oxalicibacterium faecigallinarum]